jgi:hypothetical protein
MLYVSAVLVTRGDVDLRPIIDSLPFTDIVIWDNSKEVDYKVYGRFAAMERCRHDAVYVQDDDVITSAAEIVSNYKKNTVVCNIPSTHKWHRSYYSGPVKLIGWGAIFDKKLRRAFEAYLKLYPFDDLFLRECDRIFTGLNDTKVIDVPIESMSYAEDQDRMGKEARHVDDLHTVLRRLQEIECRV